MIRPLFFSWIVGKLSVDAFYCQEITNTKYFLSYRAVLQKSCYLK